MDRNCPLSLFASCRTHQIGAELFGRVHRLCSRCLHTLQYAYGLLFFLAPLTFSPVSVALPLVAAALQTEFA
jgi:hypothetical protein